MIATKTKFLIKIINSETEMVQIQKKIYNNLLSHLKHERHLSSVFNLSNWKT